MTPKSLRILGYAFAAVPVGFGALRAITTGSDVRYLVTAIASLFTAAAIFRVGGSRVSSRWLPATIALTASTFVSRVVALWQGANSAAAVWFVAVSFSLCFVVGGILGAFSRDVS